MINPILDVPCLKNSHNPLSLNSHCHTLLLPLQSHKAWIQISTTEPHIPHKREGALFRLKKNWAIDTLSCLADQINKLSSKGPLVFQIAFHFSPLSSAFKALLSEWYVLLMLKRCLSWGRDHALSLLATSKRAFMPEIMLLQMYDTPARVFLFKKGEHIWSRGFWPKACFVLSQISKRV